MYASKEITVGASPIESLVQGIVLCAVEDYRDLKKRKVESRNVKGKDHYSINEIESFFKGDWCDDLLALIGCKLSGIDVWEKVQKQYC